MALIIFKYCLPALLGYTLFVGIAGRLNPIKIPHYADERPAWALGLWTGLCVSLVLSIGLHMAYGMSLEGARQLLKPSAWFMTGLLLPGFLAYHAYLHYTRHPAKAKSDKPTNSDHLDLSLDLSDLLDAPEIPDTYALLDAPEITDTHTLLDGPEISDTHGLLDGPEISDTHASLDGPEITDTHTLLDGPEISSTHASLDGPEITDTHASLDDPEITDTHILLDGPEITDTHASLDGPEISDTHGLLDGPEISDTHGLLDGPEIIDTHASLDGPEISDTHELAQTVSKAETQLDDERVKHAETEKHLRITRKALSVLEAESRDYESRKADSVIKLEEDLARSIERESVLETAARRAQDKLSNAENNAATLKQSLVSAKQDVRRSTAARARALSTANKSIAFARQSLQIRSQLESEIADARETLKNRQTTMSSLIRALEKEKRHTQEEVTAMAKQLALQEKQNKARLSLESVARNVENKLTSRLVKKVAKARPLTSDF